MPFWENSEGSKDLGAGSTETEGKAEGVWLLVSNGTRKRQDMAWGIWVGA